MFNADATTHALLVSLVKLAGAETEAAVIKAWQHASFVEILSTAFYVIGTGNRVVLTKSWQPIIF